MSESTNRLINLPREARLLIGRYKGGPQSDICGFRRWFMCNDGIPRHQPNVTGGLRRLWLTVREAYEREWAHAEQHKRPDATRIFLTPVQDEYTYGRPIMFDEANTLLMNAPSFQLEFWQVIPQGEGEDDLLVPVAWEATPRRQPAAPRNEYEPPRQRRRLT